MHPCFGETNLTDSQLEFTNKILGSDALAAQLITRIKRKQPTSVIRMSDGERGLIAHGQGAPRSWFLNDPNWIKEYGLEGADLLRVGRDLLTAGIDADYLACTISGVFWEEYDVASYFPDRPQFVSSFFVALMEATGRWDDVLSQAPVVVLHRHPGATVAKLTLKYKMSPTQGFRLDNWMDWDGIAKKLAKLPYSIVLTSGGAYTKPWMVRTAKETGHCILDVGAGMTHTLTAGA